jgi:hypothetical protein
MDSPVQKLNPRQLLNYGSEIEVYLHMSMMKTTQMISFVLRLVWGCFITVALLEYAILKS